MTTPADFLARCEAVVEELALLYAHTPDEAVEKSLADMLERTRAGWVVSLKAWATPEQIAEIVEDLGKQIQTRRREIEAGGAGTA
jgi:hypothetical protein